MLSKWCQTTSCNGIIHLYEARNNKPLFIIWAILMLAMLGATIFFTYKAIQGYIDSPYATSIATIANATLVFPEIMICYDGGYNVSAFKEANFSDDFSYAFMSDAISSLNIRNVSISESRNQFFNYINNQNMSYRQFYDRIEFKCSDIVKSIYSMNACDHAKKISSFDGACFALKNLGSQYRPAAGLFIELSSPNNSYASIYGNENAELANVESTVSRDFLIDVEQTLDVQPVGRYNRIPINSRVDMVLYPKFYKRIFRENRCEPNETVYPTSNACYSRCDAELTRSAGNCTLLQYSEITDGGDLDLCPPFVVFDFLLDSLKEEYTARRESCSLKCLQKCQQWTYDPIMTFSPIDEKVFKNRSYVHILYNNLQYEKIEEIESFTYDMAIANIGGQCGLWMGASIVTFIEGLFYLVLMLTNYMNRNKITISADVQPVKWDQKQAKLITDIARKQIKSYNFKN